MEALVDYDGTCEERYQHLQEYVHRLEEALCFYWQPMKYAQSNTDEFYATAIEAAHAYNHRSRRPKT